MSPEPSQGQQPANREEASICEVRPVLFEGEIAAAGDLSGVVVTGAHLALGADEGRDVYVFKRGDDFGRWSRPKRVRLAKQDQEADIEALTFGDGHLYVIGSHSARRRALKPVLSARRNRERLLKIDMQPSRNCLYRLSFDDVSGKIGKPDVIDLSKRLNKDPLLGRFVGIPSKENGIDIEGIAWRNGLLYVGFRGPVLRGNLVPVMRFSFDRPKHYQLAFVRLAGQGIRDMAALSDGFLLLSGPVNDAPGPFRLWWWDGRDQIPGKDVDIHPAVPLGAVTTPGGAKAEGLALLIEESGHCDAIVLYETNTASQAVHMRIDLPR